MAFIKKNSAGYLANHMARLFAQGLHARIKPLGLAPAQFMVLLELWHDDGLTQKVLVERLDVEQATMANTIARMERDGLIERRAHENDRRARVIFLTSKAKELECEAVKCAKAQNEIATKGLSVNERELFLDLVRRVIANMNK